MNTLSNILDFLIGKHAGYYVTSLRVVNGGGVRDSTTRIRERWCRRKRIPR